MKGKTISALLLTVIFAIAMALGQTRAPAATGGKGSPHYDKATETRIVGVVEDVTPARTGNNRWAQVRLKLKSGAETCDVHVGPAAYISSQRFSFAKGDQIDVIGSKVTINGRNALLAREITKDGKVLKLRDEDGFPVFVHRERQNSHTRDEKTSFFHCRSVLLIT